MVLVDYRTAIAAFQTRFDAQPGHDKVGGSRQLGRVHSAGLRMGYDLHIRRADNWMESEQRAITRPSGWPAADDPELTLDAGMARISPSWSPHCIWFDWADGQVFTKNPDRVTLAKLLDLARRLQARVQDDDGEFYESPEDMPGDDEGGIEPTQLRRPWWRFW